MKAMVRNVIALVDKRVRTFNDPDLRVGFGKRSEVRIVLPQVRTDRPHVCGKPAGVAAVQVANRCREHNDIAGGKAALQNQLLHIPLKWANRAMNARENLRGCQRWKAGRLSPVTAKDYRLAGSNSGWVMRLSASWAWPVCEGEGWAVVEPF